VLNDEMRLKATQLNFVPCGVSEVRWLCVCVCMLEREKGGGETERVRIYFRFVRPTVGLFNDAVSTTDFIHCGMK
jgi:hypothetical protein